jgi:hypothetical protein
MLNFKHWFLLKEAEEALTLFHGTTANSAKNILANRLQNRSTFDIATNMSGEFWATQNFAYASLMAMMPGYDPPTAQNPPVVLKFSLPLSALQRMKRSWYETDGKGTYEFSAKAFSFLNRNVIGWQLMDPPLEEDAAKKWQAELRKHATTPTVA